MRVAACFAVCLGFAVGSQALAQSSPFVGHWEGSEVSCSFKGDIALDITQAADGSLRPRMHAAGVGTLDDGVIAGDTLTMNWTNFLSHVTFTGKFVSLARIEGTYHESLTGEDCTWSATNASAPADALQTQTVVASSEPADQASPPPVPPPQTPTREAALAPPSAPVAPARVETQLDSWKREADLDRQKLNARLNGDARDQAIKQFCAYAPDAAACAARIGEAYEYLAHNSFATLTIASGNKAVPLPAMAPAAGMPSFYDLYQVYAFLTRDMR